jgi:hypothetical protein
MLPYARGGGGLVLLLGDFVYVVYSGQIEMGLGVSLS